MKNERKEMSEESHFSSLREQMKLRSKALVKHQEIFIL